MTQAQNKTIQTKPTEVKKDQKKNDLSLYKDLKNGTFFFTVFRD